MATIIIFAPTPSGSIIQDKPGSCIFATYISSLPTKPNMGGSPAMDINANTAKIVVAGKGFHNFDSFVISLIPVLLSIIPATINNPPLYNPCTIKNTKDASKESGVPIPISNTIVPKALMVVKAKIRFKSFCPMEK